MDFRLREEEVSTYAEKRGSLVEAIFSAQKGICDELVPSNAALVLRDATTRC